MKPLWVTVLTVTWLVGLIVFDVWLWLDGVDGNTITQIIRHYADKSHFVPFLMGATFGGLTIHFFEGRGE